MKSEFEGYLKQCPIIAILRGLTPDNCIEIGEVLYENGVRIMEVPLNSPSPFESIRKMVKHFQGKALIGAGTVLVPEDVEKLSQVGGRIVISPNFNPDVGMKAKQLNMLWLPGVMTPTEGFTALSKGADGLKLFPSEMITPTVLKAWISVFSARTNLIPVGGVGADNAKMYMEIGACGLGIGGSIYKPADTVSTVHAKVSNIIKSLD
ncbi:MAG: 2-dehydro-3-deoxy-6-phosphogalactonate aldolase [Vibrio sp.]|uniref:2-dehydro-3-deoxy-6-phosphogalactonate aldolase n=1 Tax=Vibrio sp. TaxID=678 RepID=UPI003A8C306B